MAHRFVVETRAHRQLLEVTGQVQEIVAASGVREGICLVYCPHTTASVTVNENADPDVLVDLLDAHVRLLGDERRFRHTEANSGGHALAQQVGGSTIGFRADVALLLSLRENSARSA